MKYSGVFKGSALFFVIQIKLVIPWTKLSLYSLSHMFWIYPEGVFCVKETF